MPPAEPTPAQFANPASRYFHVTRPPFLAATLVAVLLGLGAAHHSGVVLHSLIALLTVSGALLVHAGVNVLNDYYDARNGTDDRNTDRVFPFTGGSRFIQNGVLSPAQMGWYGVALFGVAGLIGVGLAMSAGPGLVLLGAAGLVLGWGYSAPPLRLNSRGLGELTVVVGFGAFIPAGVDFVQRGELAWLPVLAGLPYGLLVGNLLYINQFPDARADAASGKRHWVVRLGIRRARWGYPLIALLAYALLALLVAAGRLPLSALIGLLPLPLSLGAARLLLRRAGEPSQLAPAIRLTILAALSHGALLALALALASPAA